MHAGEETAVSRGGRRLQNVGDESAAAKGGEELGPAEAAPQAGGQYEATDPGGLLGQSRRAYLARSSAFSIARRTTTVARWRRYGAGA